MIKEVKMKNRDCHEGDVSLKTRETIQQKYCITLNTHQISNKYFLWERNETMKENIRDFIYNALFTFLNLTDTIKATSIYSCKCLSCPLYFQNQIPIISITECVT